MCIYVIYGWLFVVYAKRKRYVASYHSYHATAGLYTHILPGILFYRFTFTRSVPCHIRFVGLPPYRSSQPAGLISGPWVLPSPFPTTLFSFPTPLFILHTTFLRLLTTLPIWLVLRVLPHHSLHASHCGLFWDPYALYPAFTRHHYHHNHHLSPSCLRFFSFTHSSPAILTAPRFLFSQPFPNYTPALQLVRIHPCPITCSYCPAVFFLPHAALLFQFLWFLPITFHIPIPAASWATIAFLW